MNRAAVKWNREGGNINKLYFTYTLAPVMADIRRHQALIIHLRGSCDLVNTTYIKCTVENSLPWPYKSLRFSTNGERVADNVSVYFVLFLF